MNKHLKYNEILVDALVFYKLCATFIIIIPKV